MSSIREAVARALHQKGVDNPTWEDWLPSADDAITAFLEAAAEQGWHMRPDEATEGMGRRGMSVAPMLYYNEVGPVYRAMLAAAPPFEWDK